MLDNTGAKALRRRSRAAIVTNGNLGLDDRCRDPAKEARPDDHHRPQKQRPSRRMNPHRQQHPAAILVCIEQCWSFCEALCPLSLQSTIRNPSPDGWFTHPSESGLLGVNFRRLGNIRPERPATRKLSVAEQKSLWKACPDFWNTREIHKKSRRSGTQKSTLGTLTGTVSY